MTSRDDLRRGKMGQEKEDLPQMDGSCDTCEPDEAQPATDVCHTCYFALCPTHAEEHTHRTHHRLAPYGQDMTQAEKTGEAGDPVGADGADAGMRLGIGGGEDNERDEAWLAEVRGAQRLVAARVIGEDGADWDGEAMLRPGAGDGNGEARLNLGDGAHVGLPQGGDCGAGTQDGQEAQAAFSTKSTVTVERLRCKEHGQEGSLYCKLDEKIICVVCAMIGEHRGHQIITLYDAFQWQKGREGFDILSYSQQMTERIKAKCSTPNTSTDEMEAYVNSQFDELHRLVRLEEKRTLHLVDLKEAYLTASAAEKIAEITVHTERLQMEMASITQQLGQLDQLDQAQQGEDPEQAGQGAAGAPVGEPSGGPREPRDIEARPRLPEPKREPMDPRDSRD